MVQHTVLQHTVGGSTRYVHMSPSYFKGKLLEVYSILTNKMLNGTWPLFMSRILSRLSAHYCLHANVSHCGIFTLTIIRTNAFSIEFGSMKLVSVCVNVSFITGMQEV